MPLHSHLDTAEYIQPHFLKNILRKKKLSYTLSFFSLLAVIPGASVAQGVGRELASLDTLKKMSLEQLMNIEVTSVSKRPEKLSEVASAIQVITSEDIRRSGATTLPEALRLSPNLQVAQYNSSAWIISARGFSNVFSNKLLVMIDGRTVYSPLFAGVFWDMQSVVLEDIDRIEVISGPGGTLWGANAVNGVINIITKNAKDTRGLYATAAGGKFLNNSLTARYGGGVGSSFNYRVFVQHNDFDRTIKPDGNFNNDNWHLNQAGFRMDWDAGLKDKVSFQGNVLLGLQRTQPGPNDFDQQDALAQWSHSFSETSNFTVQAYYDRTWRRDQPGLISDQMQQYDIDLQHRFRLTRNNNVMWGAGYRVMFDATQNATTFVGLVPADKTLHLYSGFVQDEINLAADRVKITLGTKLLHNDYSGFEIQPSARLAWTPTAHQTFWGSVSRAVRTPSRIDVDYHIPTYPVSPNTVNIGGGPNFTAEKLIAYEVGYRVQANHNLSLSLATFYNRYDDMYSVELVPGTMTYLIQNGVKGISEGAELSGFWKPFSNWQLRGGYTFFYKNLENKPEHNFDTSYEGTDPKHQVLLQSIWDISRHFEFDVVSRYVSGRPLSAVAGVPKVSEYANFDARLAWKFKKFELAVVGQNLANDKHREFAALRIPRNIYGRFTVRF